MKNKKVIGLFFSFFFLCITIVLIVNGCSNRQKKEYKLNTDSIKYEKVSKSIKCSLYMDYPIEGNDALMLMIREWVSEQLGGTYKGNYAYGDSLIKYYGSVAMDSMAHYAKDVQLGNQLEEDVRIEKKYETNKLVTYIATSYNYLGGAHGGATFTGATFRKSDGRKFGYDMFTNEARYGKMNELIKSGLKEYFKVRTDEELQQNLLAPNNIYLLPLPQNPPFFTKNGLTFVYAQYEIACYPAGMPKFTIPYNIIIKMLTVSAVSLL